MMRLLAVDSRISDEIFENLKRIDKNIIKIAPNQSLDDAVCSHPDMNLLQVKDKIFTTPRTNVRSGESVKIKRFKQGKLLYPEDVFLNAVCIDNDFICKKSAVDESALKYAESCGMRIIDVNQGYVKCNIAVVSENEKAVITEDPGIAKTLTLYGYDVLLLQTHDVKLYPYDYGFIGGASGNIDGKLLFTGNVESHIEYARIKAFCDKYSVETVSLSVEPLYDYGSILEIFID